MFKKKQEDPDLVIVKSATDGFELSMIRGLLEDNNIPYMLKDRGAGNYMKIFMGMSIYGTDIIVSKENLDRANEVLAVLDAEEDNPKDDNMEKED